MADLLEKLEGFLRDERASQRRESEDEWRDRMEKKIDRLASASPGKSRRDLLEEIAADDALLEQLADELATEADDLPAETDDGEDGAADEVAADDGEDDPDPSNRDSSSPRFRRVALKVPKIWAGDDEPDLVEYRDENGEAQVRSGYRKGQPVQEEWEEIPPDDDDENEEE